MSRDSKSPNKISRRKFIQGVSSGVVGSSLLLGSLQAGSGSQDEVAGKTHEGKELVTLKVNGKTCRLLVEPRTTLAQLLREHLQLTGTKVVCNHGECGACTVLLNGQAVYSCQMLALDAEGKEVVTIEGLMDGEKLHPIQEAFLEHDGFQCGFCTPGQIMATQALLLKHPRPSRAEVLEGMSGNLCRCAAYPHIINSVLAAAEKLSK